VLVEKKRAQKRLVLSLSNNEHEQQTFFDCVNPAGDLALVLTRDADKPITRSTASRTK
jgi:hypothetical protein